eukprot:TRINITY_DN9618_c0_g1_i1.p1 TRINITY_DN9618_c0_g1~~TRINITY_DN9618_c0_g1_i1.p1  ORF type:complete len:292 (+),score=88.15 TRINITY_DN9618_c0_g1_i1:39-914(+)
MFTVFVLWVDGSTPAVDVRGTDTVGRVKDKAAEELKVGADDFTLLLEGEEMDNPCVVVSDTTLVEGSTVEARPSKRFVARRELAEMGLECTPGMLLTSVIRSDSIARTDTEKAAVTQLMVDSNNGLDVREALIDASGKGYVNVVRVLLDYCNVNAVASFGMTALHNASSENRTEVAKLLLNRGAEVNSMNCNKWTPLHFASFYGHLDVVKLLTDAGADLRMLTRRVGASTGKTALHYARQRRQIAVAEYLADRMQDMNRAFTGNPGGDEWWCLCGTCSVPRMLFYSDDDFV